MKPQKTCKRYRFALMLGIPLGLTLLGVSTATASQRPGGWGEWWQDWALENWSNPLDDILAQIEQTTTLAEETLQATLGEPWEQLKSMLGSRCLTHFRFGTAR